jgi:hypothetical protein
MTTITKIEQQFKDNKPSGYKVNLSDGSWGYLVEKDSDKDLKDGEEVTFTAETPTGKSYKKLTIKRAGAQQQQSSSNPPQPPKPQIHVGTGKSKEELKADAAIRMAEVVIEAFFNDKVEAANVEPRTREYTKLLLTEIDEIFAGK